MSPEPAFQLSEDYTATINFSVHQYDMLKNSKCCIRQSQHCLSTVNGFTHYFSYSSLWIIAKHSVFPVFTFCLYCCLLTAKTLFWQEPTYVSCQELVRERAVQNMHFSFLPSRLLLYPQAPLPSRFAGKLWLPALALNSSEVGEGGAGRRQAGCRAPDSGMHFLIEVPRSNLGGF